MAEFRWFGGAVGEADASAAAPVGWSSGTVPQPPSHVVVRKRSSSALVLFIADPLYDLAAGQLGRVFAGLLVLARREERHGSIPGVRHGAENGQKVEKTFQHQRATTVAGSSTFAAIAAVVTMRVTSVSAPA